MSERIAIRERQRRTAARHCQHRWVIDTPHGATSRGLCKRCGTTKRFPNAPEDILTGKGKPGMGRWSARNTPARPKEITLSTSDDELL